jgi:hypothetical protein
MSDDAGNGKLVVLHPEPFSDDARSLENRLDRFMARTDSTLEIILKKLETMADRQADTSDEVDRLGRDFVEHSAQISELKRHRARKK